MAKFEVLDSSLPGKLAHPDDTIISNVMDGLTSWLWIFNWLGQLKM